MKNVSFSINLYNAYGDKFDNCLLLHIKDDFILKLEGLKALEEFIEQLQKIKQEVKELNK